MTKRLLLTGGDGFTGRHLSLLAENSGYEVFALKSNLLDASAVCKEVLNIKPTYVVHLAALSAVTHPVPEEFYRVNLFGSLNLLDALAKLANVPSRVLLAGSANIYGNTSSEILSEDALPKPVNHYAMSKLAMEYMASNYVDRLPLIFTRPFNYTGVGHGTQFVVPKIIEHFKKNQPSIELGNMDVYREYNDVRMVCDVYLRLLKNGSPGTAYNVCSGVVFSLGDLIALTERVSGKSIDVKINPKYVRPNEVKILKGNPEKLISAIGELNIIKLEDTLRWMLA